MPLEWKDCRAPTLSTSANDIAPPAPPHIEVQPWMFVFIWNIAVMLYQICIYKSLWFTLVISIALTSITRYLKNLQIENLEMWSQDAWLRDKLSPAMHPVIIFPHIDHIIWKSAWCHRLHLTIMSRINLASFPGSCARGRRKESPVHTVCTCAKFPW